MSSLLTNLFKNCSPPSAVELFSAAWCNMDCKYCYIPKGSQIIKDKHQQIIDEAIQITPIINRIKKLFDPNQIKVFGHWGTEPSLTIHHFKDFYKQAIQEFSNLDEINFSSNFMQQSKVDNVVDFIKTFPTDRKFTFDIQASLDGPKWITDENRRGGATESIIKNIVHFIKELNQDGLYHKVIVHFKPTVSKSQYPELLKNNELLNYYQFFDDVFRKMYDVNTNNNVIIITNADMTVVCPDDYTQQDGINFNRIYETIIDLHNNYQFDFIKPDLGSYYNALRKLILLSDKIYTNQHMFTCSAGDSQFGISENFQPCHDTFYLPYDEINDALLEDIDRTNSMHDIENVEAGRIDLAKKQLCLDIETLDKFNAVKSIYNYRSYHDFFKFRLSYGVSIVKEMAYSGLISSCYKNNDMARLLSAFIQIRHSCPTGHQQYYGTIHLASIDYFKLFGNGLLENFIKRFIIENKGVFDE